MQYLRKLIGEIWQQQIIPKKWSTGLICTLYTKDGPLKYSDCKEHALRTTKRKVLSNILYERLFNLILITIISLLMSHDSVNSDEYPSS